MCIDCELCFVCMGGGGGEHNLWQKLAVSPELRVDSVTEDC